MSAALTGGFTAAAAAALAKMEPTTLPHIDTLKLLQVQSTFRHGARTPMEDMGERPVEWTAAEQRAYTRPAGPQSPQYCAVSLLHAGSTQPVDALAHFCGGHSWRDSWMSSSSSLNGGGAPGILTNVGLAQANALGASLRSRYVDPTAQGEADVGRAHLLPASWEAARGLVAARSTLVERTVFTVSGLALSLTPNPHPSPTLTLTAHRSPLTTHLSPSPGERRASRTLPSRGGGGHDGGRGGAQRAERRGRRGGVHGDQRAALPKAQGALQARGRLMNPLVRRIFNYTDTIIYMSQAGAAPLDAPPRRAAARRVGGGRGR